MSKHRISPGLCLLLVTFSLFLLWQIIVWVTRTPHFILPGPIRVFKVLWAQRSLIAEHSLVTLAEILLGMALGCLLGFLSPMLLQWSRTLDKAAELTQTMYQVVLDLAASKQSQTILLGMDAQQQALLNICEKYFK